MNSCGCATFGGTVGRGSTMITQSRDNVSWISWYSLKTLTGGAIRHCDAATLKSNPVFRMMGKKTDIEVVTVMMKLCHKGFLYMSELIQIADKNLPESKSIWSEHLQRNQCEDPDFDVEGRFQEAGHSEALRYSIVSVFVDSSFHKVSLLLAKEVPWLIRFLWKINQKEICKKRSYACDLAKYQCYHTFQPVTKNLQCLPL